VEWEATRMTYEYIRAEVEDHVAMVTFDRPPVNALNRQAYDEITAFFRTLGDDREVRVAVLTGGGARAFCAGADLGPAQARSDEPPPLDSGLPVRDAFWAIYDCAVPVIGAINGAALGAGLAIAAVCDILIASERAVFGLPEINVGLLGGGRHLQRLVGPYRMRRMMFTGLRASAEEMYRFGCVEQVVPHDQLIPAARTLAAEIATKSPVAVRLAKESLNRAEFMDLKEGYRTEQDYTARLRNFEDSREARQAFLEKRPPVFKGR
jgi:enoyl-CoA hydratase